MARAKKKQDDMIEIHVRPDLNDPSRVIADRDSRNDNVVQFTGGESNQPVAASYDATQIDQFLTGYGIQIG